MLIADKTAKDRSATRVTIETETKGVFLFQNTSLD